MCVVLVCILCISLTMHCIASCNQEIPNLEHEEKVYVRNKVHSIGVKDLHLEALENTEILCVDKI